MGIAAQKGWVSVYRLRIQLRYALHEQLSVKKKKFLPVKKNASTEREEGGTADGARGGFFI